MKITAIILTYNRPQALELILESILRQKTMPDEVIIADDGSGQETLNSIQKFKKILPLPLKHVWHEDKGFRIASIRNKAIKESTGDCLIFSDGDLIFHPNFFNDFKGNNNTPRQSTTCQGDMKYFRTCFITDSRATSLIQ